MRDFELYITTNPSTPNHSGRKFGPLSRIGIPPREVEFELFYYNGDRTLAAGIASTDRDIAIHSFQAACQAALVAFTLAGAAECRTATIIRETRHDASIAARRADERVAMFGE